MLNLFSKLAASVFLTTLLVTVAQASLGPGGTGGGDIDAVRFITRATDVGDWLAKGTSPLTRDEIARYSAVLKGLVDEMDSGRPAPIRFIESPNLKDSNGVEKMAIYTVSPRSVIISRPKWRALNPDEQYRLVALELFGLSGLSDRYHVAGLIQSALPDIYRKEAGGTMVTEQAKLVFQNCDAGSLMLFSDGVAGFPKKCTRVTVAGDSLSVTTLCDRKEFCLNDSQGRPECKLQESFPLVATISVRLRKTGEYFRALARPKDEVSRDGTVCTAEITDFGDQSGFMIWSNANFGGYRMSYGSSGKSVTN